MSINPATRAQFVLLQAAADFLGNGAIEVNMYETEIFDLVRRSSPSSTASRRSRPTATRTASSRRPPSARASSPTPARSATPPPARPVQERVMYIKAMVNGSNFGLFDVQVTQQQGQFSYVEAKDVNDIISGIQVVRCQGIWQGTDTSYSSPSTIQYYGLLNQITQQATIAPGASIIDGLKAQVAKMVANTSYMVRPTAIWVNPIVGDMIDREAKAQQITLNTVEVVGGVRVKKHLDAGRRTPDPLPDPFLPSVPDSGSAYGFRRLRPDTRTTSAPS